MTNIDDSLAAAVEELRRSLDKAPEQEFRPRVTRMTNLVVAVVAAVVVLALVAIPAWLTRDANNDITIPPASTAAPSTTSTTSTTAATTTMDAILVAELDDLILLNPVVLDDGSIVAKALLIADPNDQPEPGFGRSTDVGANWTFVPSEENLGRAGLELAAVGNVLVSPVWDVGTGHTDVMVSQDSGATWSTVVLPVPADYVALGFRGGSVVVDDAGRFVVYGGNGKWVSSDGVNWEASIQDNSNRSLMRFPQMINDVLVATGEDDRIYAGVPGEALEVAYEPNARGVSLAAGNDRVVAWGTSLADSGGTWLGITTDGQNWSEHLTDLSLAVVEPLSDELGAGYLGITPGSVSNAATVYRSQDLDTWTEVARINGDAIGYQVVETDHGILALARGGDQQTLWFVDLQN